MSAVLLLFILIIWHVVTVCYFLMFFPPPENYSLTTKNDSSPSFWPRWLKQTSFCRKFNCLDSHIAVFLKIRSLSSKNTQHKQKTWLKRRFLQNRFGFAVLNLIFQKFGKPICEDLLQVIISEMDHQLCCLWNCRRGIIFCRAA